MGGLGPKPDVSGVPPLIPWGHPSKRGASVRTKIFHDPKSSTPRRLLTIAGAAAVVAAGLAPAAFAASTVSASFSSTDTTHTATVGGKLYARQGAALTLNATTESAQCLR